MINCRACKHFEQPPMHSRFKGAEDWGRCAKASSSLMPVLFYPDGDYCADVWLEVREDFGCIMGEERDES